VHFATLTDPRVGRTRVHRLSGLATLALRAILCGANDWVAVPIFRHAREPWPRTFLALPGSIPSHDAIRWVFVRLDPAEFQRYFVARIQAEAPATQNQVVAVDGKPLRRSHDRS
jgi:hypothetical protein